MKNQTFVYHIKSVDNGNSNVDVMFTIDGNGSVTLAMLPFGKYEITILDWAWRYEGATVRFDGEEFSETNGTIELLLDDTGDIEFDYSNVTRNNQWITDDSSGQLVQIIN